MLAFRVENGEMRAIFGLADCRVAGFWPWYWHLNRWPSGFVILRHAIR